MSAGASLIRGAAFWVATVVMAGLVGYPRALPDVLERGVGQAVDEAARVWLWTWNEPTDLLDHAARLEGGEMAGVLIGTGHRLDGAASSDPPRIEEPEVAFSTPEPAPAGVDSIEPI